MNGKISSQLLWRSKEKLLLGENPLWDVDAQTLYYVDAADPAVYRLEDGAVTRFAMPKPVASIFLTDSGRLMVAMRNGFAELRLSDGTLADVGPVKPPSAEERFNDGRCGPDGRMWISTMDRKLQDGVGTITQINGRYGSQSFRTGAKLGNGVCFSPDGKWLYFSDTVKRAIYRYPTGEPCEMEAAREQFIQLDDAPGRPDGCSVDSDGCLWSARVGGGRIDRYAPDGELLGYLDTPMSHPTHCTFGGPDLRTLFVTSSRYPANSKEFEAQEDAGRVMAFEVGATGLPEARFLPSMQSTAA